MLFAKSGEEASLAKKEEHQRRERYRTGPCADFLGAEVRFRDEPPRLFTSSRRLNCCWLRIRASPVGLLASH